MNINLYSNNKVYLNDPEINSQEFNVKFSLENEMGEYLSSDKELKEVIAKFDSTKKQWYAEFKLAEGTKGKYLRLSFDIVKDGSTVSSNQAVMDLELTRRTTRLVPYQYFLDYILNTDLNPETKEKVEKYSRQGIEEYLSSAHGDLEMETELSFIPKVVETEYHDYYADNFKQTYWLIQLYEWPIIEVISWRLKFGDIPILDLDPTKLQVDPLAGTITFLPTSRDPFFMLHYAAAPLEATHLSVMTRAMQGDWIPNAFQLSYKFGLDFLTLPETEQSSIRTAIARRASTKLLPRILPEFIHGSESFSVDGASYSKSNQGLAWLTQQKNEEVDWIDKIKRKYNKNVKVITA